MKASPKWKEIGRQLGFKLAELDEITLMEGLHNVKHYYSEMLGRWVEWTPPEPHYFPTLDRLISVLRSKGVGEERLAYTLEQKGLN